MRARQTKKLKAITKKAHVRYESTCKNCPNQLFYHIWPLTCGELKRFTNGEKFQSL